MKKLILLTAICGLASLSFKADDAAKTNLNSAMMIEKPNCSSLAFSVYDAYLNAGYSNRRASKEANEAYEDCVANGGDPGNVIIING